MACHHIPALKASLNLLHLSILPSIFHPWLITFFIKVVIILHTGTAGATHIIDVALQHHSAILIWAMAYGLNVLSISLISDNDLDKGEWGLTASEFLLSSVIDFSCTRSVFEARNTINREE